MSDISVVFESVDILGYWQEIKGQDLFTFKQNLIYLFIRFRERLRLYLQTFNFAIFKVLATIKRSLSRVDITSFNRFHYCLAA
jgi:hypothetical protein